jgi:hypothetical protein
MTERAHSRVRMRAVPELEANAFSLRVEMLPGRVAAGDERRIDECVEWFVFAVNAGICAGHRFEPRRSGAVVVESSAPDGSGTDIACHDVDAGAARLLANLVRMALGEREAPMPVLMTSGRDGRAGLAMVDELPYPAGTAQAPFELGISLPGKSLEPVTLRLEFAAPPSEAEIELLTSRVLFWKDLVGRGAYFEPESDPDDRPDVDEVEIYWLSPYQFEATVYGCVAADAAFDGFVNMLARTDDELGAKLSMVEIW